LLVVSMADRRLLRLEPGGLVEHADLTAVCPGNCNDMVVDGHGNAYVGNTGYPYAYRGQPVPVRTATCLVLVTADGDIRPQHGTLMFPNGSAISADGMTLVVAQSHAGRLTAYAIAENGSLRAERPFAALPARCDNPDGICIDAEGAVWVADPHHRCCFRVRDGGQITHIVDTDPWECVACALGGVDRRTLFLVLVPSRDLPGREGYVIGGPPVEPRGSRVEAIEVDVPGAGWP
jgi:sugar lactone lactonase YvrE